MVRILFWNHTWTFSRCSSLTCAANWTVSTLMSTSFFSRKKPTSRRTPLCFFHLLFFLFFLYEHHKVNGDVFTGNQVPLLKYTSKTQRGDETDRREEQIRSELFFINVISLDGLGGGECTQRWEKCFQRALRCRGAGSSGHQRKRDIPFRKLATGK